MKRTSPVFLILLVQSLVAQTPNPSAPPVDRSAVRASGDPHLYKPGPVSETKLPNGLTVVVAEDSRFPLVSERLVFLAGSKRDPAGMPGLSAVVAGMLTRLTMTRTERSIAEELDGMGGELETFAGPDYLAINANVLAENFPGMLTLISDISRNALFPTESLQNQIQRSVLAQHAKPAYLANEEYRKSVFGENPYAHIGANADTVSKIDAKALQDFCDNFLVPNNAYLILAGKLPARADLMKAIEAEFGSWKPKTLPPYAAPRPPEPKRQIILVDRPDSEEAEIRLGRLAPTYSDNAFFPEIVASIIEGRGPESRLFLGLRDRGVGSNIHTELSELADAGIFSVVGQVKDEAAGDTLQEILSSLDRMTKEPVGEQELTDAKNDANSAFLFGLESQDGVSDRLTQIRVMNLPKNYLETYMTRINSVTSDQIQTAAKNYMAPSSCVIVVVGDALKLRPLLAKLGDVQVIEVQSGVSTSQ